MTDRDPTDSRDRDAMLLARELAEVKARLDEAQAAAVSLRAALDASHHEVDTLYASLSWRVTRPLRAGWDLVTGLPSFFRELRGFPRRARYTVASRGLRALASDVKAELVRRLRAGSLAPPAPDPAFSLKALSRRRKAAERGPLRLPSVDRPAVTIVVPAFNEFEHTYDCLASILETATDRTYEVVVADDGSRDETREIERMVAGVRVVRSETNHGFIDACNKGAAAARGDVLVFLNNDTIVTPGWLDALLAPLADPGVGLVGGKLVYPDGRLQEAGGILFSDASGWNYGRADAPTHPRYEYRRDVDYCSGACIAIHRERFAALGGFDTGLAPMYYEDVDLAFAVRAAGQRVVFEPRCVVVHVEGGTAGTDTGSGAKRYQAVNREKFREKWALALADQHAATTHPEAACERTTGPHVLVIDSYTPRADQDAGSLRMVNLFRVMKQLGCRVTFLPENRSHDGVYTHALQALGVEAFYHPYLPSLTSHLAEYGHRYDVVLMSRVDVAEAVIDAVARHCPGARRVFDTVDLHFLREQRRSDLDDRAGDGKAERLKERELAVARACDVTLVVSPFEREVLAREAPDLEVGLLSLLQDETRTTTPFAERSEILFVGNFQHPPNIDAMVFYLDEIHPRVAERLPDAVLTVVGANLPGHLERRARPGVRFTGQVPDLGPYMAAARLSVAPLRYGAGIKGKITSSLAAGVPVVSTPVGIEGIDLVDGEDVLVAADADAFADRVVELFGNEALWHRLAQNGSRRVAEQFSFDRASVALRGILGMPADEVGAR